MTIRRASILCFLFSLAGLLTALYLSVLHLSLFRGELLGGPFCGGAGHFLNCHAVAASRFSRFLGVPLAFWGVLAYLLLMSLSFVALKFTEIRRQALTAAAASAAALFLLDMGLLWLMLAKVGALCLFCLLMYLFKGLIVLTVKRGLGKRWDNLFKPTLSFMLGLQSPFLRPAIWLVVWVAAVGLAGILSVHATSRYFARTPGGLQDRILIRMRTAERVAVEPGDSPRRGDPSAPVQAVMFTDPLCPLCREALEFNEIALKAHPDDLSIVVKQFPLDQQGVRAALLEGHSNEELIADVKQGKTLGVIVTPTYFVNGVKIQGAITSAQFDEIIKYEDNRISNQFEENP